MALNWYELEADIRFCLVAASLRGRVRYKTLYRTHQAIARQSYLPMIDLIADEIGGIK